MSGGGGDSGGRRGDAGDDNPALRTALAKLESFQACEGLIRQQATLLHQSVDLHRRAMQIFAQSYAKALPSLDAATVDELRRYNDDVMAFMQQAQQLSLQSVEQLQTIVERLAADVRAASSER